MIVLKVISIIYMIVILLVLVSNVQSAKDPGESFGSKVLFILQAGAIAYIIMN